MNEENKRLIEELVRATRFRFKVADLWMAPSWLRQKLKGIASIPITWADAQVGDTPFVPTRACLQSKMASVCR